MSAKTWAQILKPAFDRMSFQEKQQLATYMKDVTRWVEMARTAHLEMKNEKGMHGHNDPTTFEEGIQEPFLASVERVNRLLLPYSISLNPRELWPEEVPYSEKVKPVSYVGIEDGRKIPTEKRVKGREKPLNVAAMKRKASEAEKIFDASQPEKPRRGKPDRMFLPKKPIPSSARRGNAQSRGKRRGK